MGLLANTDKQDLAQQCVALPCRDVNITGCHVKGHACRARCCCHACSGGCQRAACRLYHDAMGICENRQWLTGNCYALYAAGGGGIESLLLRMIALKDSNFSLLSYVADLNAEVDKTEGQITALTAELDQYRGSGASAADARRQNLEVCTRYCSHPQPASSQSCIGCMARQ